MSPHVSAESKKMSSLPSQIAKSHNLYMHHANNVVILVLPS